MEGARGSIVREPQGDKKMEGSGAERDPLKPIEKIFHSDKIGADG